MAVEFEFLSPTDKPALLGISNPEFIQAAQTALTELEYKVHVATGHENFLERFGQAQYQVVVLEDRFGNVAADQNVALTTIQGMAMGLRRHATFILIGQDYKTLAPMQAFQQSVHAVLNPADLGQIKQVIIRVMNDTTLFLNTYRDVQSKQAQGRK